MSGDPLIDWAAMAVSLFNAILLVWLGLSVLLNAERRNLGLWIAGSELLLGGIFFLVHSVILGYGFNFFSRGLDFWWHVGWVPVIALPYAWYAVMLWYSGFWDRIDSPLRKRHRVWLPIASILALLVVALVIFANPLPSFSQIAFLNLSETPSLLGIPILVWAYPFYITGCIALSLDVLARPGPSGRMMGGLARRRARPWLIAASLTLFLTTAVVAWVMFWAIAQFAARQYDPVITLTLARVDLVIASLIAVAILLVGQAIVSYEVFTGKSLPRRGLQRYWARLILLASGYAVLVSATLTLPLRPVYSVLLSAMLMVVFYALIGWRAYIERERTIQSLRPFVASPHLYEHLLATGVETPTDGQAEAAFQALCEGFLEAERAYLVPIGPQAALVGPSLAYPLDSGLQAPRLGELARRLARPDVLYTPVDPAEYGGAHWAIPLHSPLGPGGVLLVGAKRSAGLYTQEEIEIARSSGERLVDILATAELSRRLMSLQRERMVQSQVLDNQTRRVLHDEILPQLHAILLKMGGQAAGQAREEIVTELSDVHRAISALLRSMPGTGAPELRRLGLLAALKRATDGEFAQAFERIDWEITPEAESAAAHMPGLHAEVLYYAAREALRNAARHGRGPDDQERPLHLRLRASCSETFQLAVQDNGVGVKTMPTPSESSGQGLSLHATMMAVIGGSLAVESLPGEWTRVVLSLPVEGSK